jgi:bifunctional DNA-binding transcriptional regulator/antitoxin component of YhaV-PrlF toxin-antitoxin module
LGRRGEVVIPGEIRSGLELKQGDRIDLCFDSARNVLTMIPRNRKLSELKGILREELAGVGPVDIEGAIAAHLREKHDRIGHQWEERQEFLRWREAKSKDAAE